MIVCSCAVISDREIANGCLCGSGKPTVAGVFASLGRVPECGRCGPLIAETVKKHCCGKKNARVAQREEAPA